MHKKIPYGLSNFERLIAENYYYVDKTSYIEVLENFNEPYICFFRPRRFGKSLFVSMLCSYETAEELRQVPNLLKFVVVFKGDECVYAEGWDPQEIE